MAVPKDALLALTAVVGAGLLFPLQAGVDAHRSPPMELVDTLGPPELLSIMAFGHRESAADVLEIRITNALGRRMDLQSRLDRAELEQLYGALLTLDPQNAGAAYRGSIYLSSTADSAGAAIRLLSASLGDADPDYPQLANARARTPVHSDHPRRWLLYHEWAAIHFLMFRQRADDPERRAYHTRRAGELWLKCAEQPGADAWLTNVGRKLVGEGWTNREAIEHEIRLWERQMQLGDERQRERAQARLEEAQCALITEVLQEKVDALAAAGKPVTHLRQLPLGDQIKDREHLSDMDPLGVGFYLYAGQQVVAPAWRARKAERSVADLFHRFRMVHPDRLPTHEDLRLHAIPHLKVEITEAGVSVTGVIPEGH